MLVSVFDLERFARCFLLGICGQALQYGVSVDLENESDKTILKILSDTS